MGECTATFHLAPARWESREAGVGIGVEWSRRGIQLWKVREIRRSGGRGDGVETWACIFGEFELWRNPATLIEYWCYVYMEVYRLQNRMHNLDHP